MCSIEFDIADIGRDEMFLELKLTGRWPFVYTWRAVSILNESF